MAPYGTTLQLSFTVEGRVQRQYLGLTLDLHEDLLSNKATYTTFDATGSRQEAIPNYAYKGIIRDANGRGPELGWVRATIVDDNTAYLYVLNYLEGDLLVVEPTQAALQHSPHHTDVRRLSKLGHTMVAYRHHADASEEHKSTSASFQKMRSLIQGQVVRNVNVHPVGKKLRTSRNLALMPAWLRNSLGVYKGAYGRMSGKGSQGTVTCPAIQQRMKMGIATDAGFYQGVAGSAQSNQVNDKKVMVMITNIMQISNVLFTDQINVFVQLAQVLLYSTPNSGQSWDSNGDSATDWNQKPSNFALLSGGSIQTHGCDASRAKASGYSGLLDKFKNWKSKNLVGEGKSYGLWHLLTACFPSPGVVGIAYLGATCASHSVGWSNFGPTLWATFAHEVGHNFGASHTMDSGGIMSYDRAKELKFTGNNPYTVCSHVKSKMQRNNGCYTDFGATW